MKTYALLIVLVLLLAGSALAQDATSEPVVTAEPTAAATVEVIETEAAPVTINIEAPDTPAAPADTGNFTEIVLLISNVIAYGIILAQSVMQNGSVNRKTLDSFFAGLKGLGKFIPGENDDKLFSGAEAAVNTFLGERPPNEAQTQSTGTSAG